MINIKEKLSMKNKIVLVIIIVLQVLILLFLKLGILIMHEYTILMNVVSYLLVICLVVELLYFIFNMEEYDGKNER